MVEVEMSKDLRDCEPKFLGPFNKRQLICVSIAACISLPVFFLLNKEIDLFIRIVIALITAIPAIACGWINMFGMPFEQFIIHLIRTQFLTPTKRSYSSINAYEELCEDITNNIVTKKKKRNIKDGRIK